jgi:lysophospholipase L1-like esterase
MNTILAAVCFTSVTVNILFLILASIYVAKRGGVAFLLQKISFGRIKPNQKQPTLPTFYLQRKSLLDVLPLDGPHAIFLGDSIVHECEWSELFDNRSSNFGSLKIKNRGISGDTTVRLRGRLDDILESKPQKIFLMIGVNDLHEKRPIPEIIRNYSEILTRIKNSLPDTAVFIHSVLPVNHNFRENKKKYVKNKNVVSLNSCLQTLAGEFSYPYIDLFSHFADYKNQLSDRYTLDGSHLNGKGYLLWKQLIEQEIGLQG